MEQSFEAVAYVDGVELDYGAVTWDWDFGDATDHSTDNPTTHTYQDAGSYTVRVTATYGTLSGYAEIQADVGSEGGSPPDADATLTFLQGGTVCDFALVNVAFTRPGQDAPAPLKQRWSYDSVQYEYDYQTQQGPAPPITLGDWDPATHSYSGSWMSWQGKNDDPWTFEIDFQCCAGPPPTTWPVTAGPVTVKAKNTVVTSGTDVLLHHTGDQHQINWNIVHKDVTGLVFNVTVRIYDMSGTTVRTLKPPAQSGPGAGNVTWDGTNDTGQDPGPGVYAYTVSAGHGEGANSCGDRDKSMALTLNAPTLSDWEFSVPDMHVTADLTHSASQGGAHLHWDIYDPDLDSVGSGGHSSATATPHTDATGFDVDPGGPFGTWTYVLRETEDATQAALNRSGKAKPALQRGVGNCIWPKAYNRQTCADEFAPFDLVGPAAVAQSTIHDHQFYAADAVQGLPFQADVFRMWTDAPLYSHLSHASNPWPSVRLGYLPGDPHAVYRGIFCKRAGNNTFDPDLDIALEDIPSGMFKNLLCVVLAACFSGEVNPNGDLLGEMCRVGAKAAIGFEGHVYASYLQPWASKFWDYTCGNGYGGSHTMLSASAAAARAAADVIADYGRGGGVDSQRCVGDALLVTAHYGQ